jgi:sortase A
LRPDNDIAARTLKRIQSVLPTVSFGLLIAGIAALAYASYILASGYLYQAREGPQFDHPLPASNPPPLLLTPGAVIGQIEIPRIGLKAVIAEGDSPKILRKTVGHVPQTALPGQHGNVALAGHRDTFFRPLRNIRVGDHVLIKTRTDTFQYEVDATTIVAPQDLGPLKSTRTHKLTLITCFPFDYIGPAPRRFIVRAREVLDIDSNSTRLMDSNLSPGGTE